MTSSWPASTRERNMRATCEAKWLCLAGFQMDKRINDPPVENERLKGPLFAFIDAHRWCH
jgi:hypothetical protein